LAVRHGVHQGADGLFFTFTSLCPVRYRKSRLVSLAMPTPRWYLAGPASSRGKAVTRNQRGAASVQGQQFEERLRIAERVVQALCEAGHSCELADKAYYGVDLPSRH
jgi:hypothetical protein